LGSFNVVEATKNKLVASLFVKQINQGHFETEEISLFLQSQAKILKVSSSLMGQKFW